MSESTNTTEHDDFARWLGHLLVIAAGVAGAIFIAYFLQFRGGLSPDHSTWAEFGDFAGGTIGTALSFFALFALLLTVSLQSKALRISQQELKLTRQEAAKASKAAEAQVEHFNNQAQIDDIIASIKELEGEIHSRGNQTLVAFNTESGQSVKVPLRHILSKDMLLLSKLSTGYPPPADTPLMGNRHKELGKLFKLLFDQIQSLKKFSAAENRYWIFLQKHLETFFQLDRIDALPFDWLSKLDMGIRDQLENYEESLRDYELEQKKRSGERR